MLPLNLEPEIPGAFRFLFGPEEFIVAYGGRGSGKSENIARMLLLKAAQQKRRVLCARELQNSIKESVHQVLTAAIEDMGLGPFYQIQEQVIRSVAGSEFIFKGLRSNISEIKSLHGVTDVWVEEAQKVSKASWDTLLPTIRTPGAQFYISFNPLLEDDDTYQRWVISPPLGAVVRKVNWDQNPYFPENLKRQKDHLKETDYDAYLQVWEGHCRVTLDGAVFASELRAATEAKRITRVPYDPSKPVSTFWDLGRRDLTAIWFVQQVGFEFRVLDYYENRGQLLPHYLAVLQQRGYVYDTHWLPHDAQNKLLGAQHTIEEQVRAANTGRVRIVPKGSVANRINAARTVFPRCFFDEERCGPVGLMRLRNWRYEVDPDTGQWSANPLHDDNSNGADAFTYFAVSMTEEKQAKRPVASRRPHLGFMAG